ncbi:MAG: hypothetical protein JXR76_20405 [Deltaproteobacteria bacterium]|nr:hypothetical protein [Deltaproteobacteria bacterium]
MLFAGVTACVLLCAQLSNATSRDITNAEVRLSAGVRSIFLGWVKVPSPISLKVDADVLRYVRLQAQTTHHLANGVYHSGFSAGPVFTPLGRGAVGRGGFQLKWPILLGIGFFSGTVDPGNDGYDDDLRWLLWRLTTGLDLTWWKGGRAGFYLGFELGLTFKTDKGSNYNTYDDNVTFRDTHVIPELGLYLGIAFH